MHATAALARTSPDRLSVTLAALADPTRRAILTRLSRGEATVSELAEPFAISQPAVSRHLRVLKDAGLIEEGRMAQYRPRRLRPEPLREVSTWLDQYRKLWDDRLDRLEDYLGELQGRESGRGKRPRRSGR